MIYRRPLLRLRHFRCFGAKSEKEKNIHYAGFARHALLEGLQLLKIGKPDNVLVPDYICREVIEPFRAREVQVRYYKIRDDFSVNRASLEEKADKNTKAVLYVNYFGLINDCQSYLEFCRDNDLYLIEDNAHVLPSDYNRLKGDIAIFSLNKFFPVPNGAVLAVGPNKEINKEPLPGSGLEKKLHFGDYKFIIGAIFRTAYHYLCGSFLNKALLRIRKKKQVLPYQPKIPEKFSRLSYRIINNSSFYDLIARRKDNCNWLLGELKPLIREYLQIPFDQIKNTSGPLALPLIVKKNRDDLIDTLFLKGYAAYGWPDLPEKIVKGEEPALSAMIVLLPIHQDLRKRDLGIMVRVIKEWVNKIDTSS